MNRYPWIPTRPTNRRRHIPDRPYNRRDDETCHRCGYVPVGRRKKCPACMARLSPVWEAECAEFGCNDSPEGDQ